MSFEIEANPNQSTDEHLLNLVALQDVAAYEILYDRHAATIFSLIMRIVGEPRAAEDLLQDVFWQIWRTAERFDSSVPARAWMFHVARNRSLDDVRRRHGRLPAVAAVKVDDGRSVSSEEQASAESEAEYQLNRRDVQTAIADLPPEQRICVELAYFDGFSHQEIGENLKVPIDTVKSRLRIGMEKLERSLKRVT